jgi:hypothetical protein
MWLEPGTGPLPGGAAAARGPRRTGRPWLVTARAHWMAQACTGIRTA